MAALAGLAWLMLSESVLRPRYEVLYHLSPIVSQCIGERCVALYRLLVANSGREAQERVDVRWPAQFAGWQIDWSSSDLQGGHEIRNLAPNTLVELSVRCLDCTRGELEAARQASVRIEARGKIMEREPRVTMLGRASTNIARVVGIFF
ncbi:MAG: hypothetical protein JF611_05620 [Betaproteobacteria bacterium]|nr:hypothetical protein [Betaproteobacteria bacterium]